MKTTRPSDTPSLFPVVECLRGVVFALVVMLLVQTFLFEGLLTPYIVSSCSMSPYLRGPHVALQCPECQTTFCIETGHMSNEFSPDDLPLRRATCPGCAFAQVPVFADSIRKGDRIFVNRAALSLRPVRRWDVVLFRTPDDGRLTVKRVVGLPGEQIEIRDGDLYADWRIAVKPFAVQEAIRIPVPFGRWEMQIGTEGDQHELAWRPIRNLPHAKPFFGIDADVQNATQNPTQNPSFYGVTNGLCENQWRIERGENVFPVHDLMLEFDWRPESTLLSLGGVNGATGERFRLDLEPRGETFRMVPIAGPAAYKGRLPRRTGQRPHKITLSLFDHGLQLRADGRLCCELRFDENASPLSSEDGPNTEETAFAFFLPEYAAFSQTEQETIIKKQVTNMRVWRDVYYTQQPDDAVGRENASRANVVTVPEGCYYLLGDNSGFSVDGRCWREPFVAKRHMIGIVTP